MNDIVPVMYFFSMSIRMHHFKRTIQNSRPGVDDVSIVVQNSSRSLDDFMLHHGT